MSKSNKRTAGRGKNNHGGNRPHGTGKAVGVTASTVTSNKEEGKSDPKIGSDEKPESAAPIKKAPKHWKRLNTYILTAIALFQISVAIVATKAAIDAANAAKQSIDIARDTAEKQLRAYVFAGTATVSDFTKPGPIKISVTVTNFGHTPAKVIKSAVQLAAIPFPSKPPNVPESLPTSTEILTPNVESHWEGEIPELTPEQKQLMHDGKFAIWATGDFKYVDVFGNQHHSKCCFVTGGYANKEPGIMTISFEGNEFD